MHSLIDVFSGAATQTDTLSNQLVNSTLLTNTRKLLYLSL